jgi:glycine dehydrogenase
MAGMKVIPVKCDSNGNLDMADLESKAEQNKDKLAVIMVTYPSTLAFLRRELEKFVRSCIGMADRYTWMGRT